MHIPKITRRHNNIGAPSGWLDSSDPENPPFLFPHLRGRRLASQRKAGFCGPCRRAGANLRSGSPPVFYGLAELEQRTSDDMLSKCAELAAIVDTWYSNVIPEAQRVALYQFNLSQEQKHLAGIDVSTPPCYRKPVMPRSFLPMPTPNSIKERLQVARRYFWESAQG